MSEIAIQCNPHTQYTWGVQYENDLYFYEFDNGVQHLFDQIDLSRAEKFFIHDHEGENIFGVNLLTGEFNLNGIDMESNSLPPLKAGEKYRPIWFKRTKTILNPRDLDARKETVQYVFGVQTTFEGKNYQQLIWVQEDNSIRINGEK